MDDPGIVRVVCGYDMVEATLYLKTETDVTNYRREEGAEECLYKDNIANEFRTFVHSTQRHVTLPALVYKFPRSAKLRCSKPLAHVAETILLEASNVDTFAMVVAVVIAACNPALALDALQFNDLSKVGTLHRVGDGGWRLGRNPLRCVWWWWWWFDFEEGGHVENSTPLSAQKLSFDAVAVREIVGIVSPTWALCLVCAGVGCGPPIVRSVVCRPPKERTSMRRSRMLSHARERAREDRREGLARAAADIDTGERCSSQ
jgi:hypothetical protein